MKIILGLILVTGFPIFAQSASDVEGVPADCIACHATVESHQAVDVPEDMKKKAEAMELEVFGNVGGDSATADPTKATK